jgi:hypothetical protein
MIHEDKCSHSEVDKAENTDRMEIAQAYFREVR